MDLFDRTPSVKKDRINLLVLGDTKTGKTSLLNSFTGIRIGVDALGKPPKTISAITFVKEMIIAKRVTQVHLYDFSGDQDKLQYLSVFLRMLIFRDTSHKDFLPIHGIFLVFDVNNKSTLYGMKTWYDWCQNSMEILLKEKESIEQNLNFSIENSLKELPVFILGNKFDKVKNEMRFSLKDEDKALKQHKRMKKFVKKICDYLSKTYDQENLENMAFVSVDEKEVLEEVIGKFIRSIKEKETTPSFKEIDSDIKKYGISKLSPKRGLSLPANNFFSSIFNKWKGEYIKNQN